MWLVEGFGVKGFVGSLVCPTMVHGSLREKERA